MIFYAEDEEAWLDNQDENFKIQMTPDIKEEYPTFTDQQSFWKYYNHE